MTRSRGLSMKIPSGPGSLNQIHSITSTIGRTKMTYARARLCLGISGVGSLVVLTAIAFALRLPEQLFSGDGLLGVVQVLQLSALAAAFMLWLLPFDFLGGFWLPRRFGKSEATFLSWFNRYLQAALIQAALFVLFGTLILALGQVLGNAGALLALLGGMFICAALRHRWVLARKNKSSAVNAKLMDAISLIQSWEIFVPRTVVVDHEDVGFTGGIIGLGKNTQIVIPHRWLAFSTEHLATAIARRAIAINSGSYRRGLAIALVWNVVGFLICTYLPNAGLDSVASLVTTVCGFTLWSFLGLLLLPTVSRNASLTVDRLLVQQGTPVRLISDTAFQMDQLQDGEYERPFWIETIFHPVPKVSSRGGLQAIHGLAAWNVARTTLFFSWACLGFLSRSVHCNVGRPELWTMLPSD